MAPLETGERRARLLLRTRPGHPTARRWWTRRWPVWLVTSLILIVVSAGLAISRLQPTGGASSGSPVSSLAEGTKEPTVSSATAIGGTFRQGLIGQIETLNPLIVRTTAERAVSILLFEGLVWVDGSGIPQPALAARWETNEDGLEYTVHLRKDALWHDGQPITARDVLFTVRLVQAPDFPGDPTLADFWRSVQVTVIDEWTVRFRLVEPYAPFPTYLTLPIVPEHVLEGTLSSDLPRSSFSVHPVGSGPYQVERADLRTGAIELVRFAGYQRPQPIFERMTIRLFGSAEEALSAFREGELDALEPIPWKALQDGQLLGKHARIYTPSLAGFTAIFLNGQAQFFTDVRVRQALSLAIDRARLIRDVLGGQAELGNGPIPPASWAYQEQDYRYDPTAAVRLLRDAGWEDRDGDGIVDKEGLSFRFTLLVNVDDPQRIAVAEAVAQQLSEIGLGVTVQPIPAASLERLLLDRQFTAAVFGWMSKSGDPDMFELWHSTQADGGANITGFRSRTVDILLEQARRSLNRSERRSLYVEFQRLFAEYVPAIVLYYPRYCFVVSDHIGGIDASPLVAPEDHFRQIPRWYRVQR